MFKISLRSAREMSGYTVEDVAKQCGILTEVMDRFEEDCRDMPISIGLLISDLYKLPPSIIYIGPESEYINMHRKLCVIMKQKQGK